MGRDNRARRVEVIGPAYLDRVLRVVGPLRLAATDPPLDRGADGILVEGSPPGDAPDPRCLLLKGGAGELLVQPLPGDWPGPVGVIQVPPDLFPWAGRIEVPAASWADDLGGMGAGFAAALGGELTTILGGPDDRRGDSILARLAGAGVAATPVRRPGLGSDWTLLLSSGPHGDKLPIGFRGCWQGPIDLPESTGPADLLVVAGGTNRLAEAALQSRPARIRMFAPALRNMRDRDTPVASFLDEIDVLTCNRREWAEWMDSAAMPGRLSLLSVTDGPAGAILRFREAQDGVREIALPAFPRQEPPRDTNRAGEAFGATLIGALMDDGWSGGPLAEDILRRAGLRASVAAALVLDELGFRFPAPEEIDRALREGIVRPGPR